MQTKNEIGVVGLIGNDPERENFYEDTLGTMIFDLCGMTHTTGQPHPGCAGCGECMALRTYGLVPWGWNQ